MAIVTEFFRTREDGVWLNRTYSDKNLMIRKLGTDEIYDEAIDVASAPYGYVETDDPIELPEQD